MSNLSIFDFQSNNIRFENRDGKVWVNLTDMAKASGSDTFLSFHRTKKGLQYIQCISIQENVIPSEVHYTDSTGTWAETLMFLCILSNIQPFTLQFEIKDWYYKIHNFTREQVNTYLFKQIKEEGGFVQLLEKLKPIEKTYPNFAYEYEYSDYLAKELKGQREVNIPNGRIDILTETEIIEVKEKVNWLEAAEQVNRYHLYFPSLSKRIFLFGKSKKYTNQYIEEYCTKLNILVSFVDN